MRVDWVQAQQAARHGRLIQLERVLWGLALHGPSVMHEPEAAKAVQWMRDHWQHGYQQVRAKEREVYWARQATANKPAAHAPGCACWDCVLKLHGEAARHQAKLAVKRGEWWWG